MDSLQIESASVSERGPKAINQDAIGAYHPEPGLMNSKGAAYVICDGISSSDVSGEAAHIAVNSFLSDYYSTPESWTVRTSLWRVASALNHWLYTFSRNSEHRSNRDKGYVCTFAALVIKGNQAHIAHAGDSRVYRIDDSGIELLTRDHTIRISDEEQYLGRALGASERLDLDYRSVAVHRGDTFLLTTDGVHDVIDDGAMRALAMARRDHLSERVQALVSAALAAGTKDNASAQIVSIQSLPEKQPDEVGRDLVDLPLPYGLAVNQNFEGYRILRQLHANDRSRVFLAADEVGQKLVIKLPASDQRHNDTFVQQMAVEEWVARRMHHPCLMAAYPAAQIKKSLYTCFEYIDGQTLKQWLLDNPEPSLTKVRDLVRQIARGLQAFHRMEMVHQDLRPENVMVTEEGNIKIIDFGSTWVQGLDEQRAHPLHALPPGSMEFMAPEYLSDAPIEQTADLYSLGAMTYYLLTHRLPYGTDVIRMAQEGKANKLVYRSIRQFRQDIPEWVDASLRKCVHPNPQKRYSELSEFIFALNQPDSGALNGGHMPLIERDPVRFWQSISAILLLTLFGMVAYLH
ncbi:bifunctional protein-serine/threonine kinase/phosphatase [Parendozoicomonas haliclonae]|uniref:Serine/threonine-protein kinase PrkC n=1 Tax=Parendozoicomonas haliclonae TaxID=1960125 RepID=A0A1X7AIS1_9GAMM|nr:bifunctional protein-serine/threonine kinase/phosphatase [Parendozoicomonas haliclonae]SMA44140.1 Serine/threonine-protein kinase PrkC [Parendozoicomonas haliclonae]